MRLAIVTGGSKGLGRALCSDFLEQGFHVLEFSRSAPHPYSVHADFNLPLDAQAIVSKTFAELASQQWEEIVLINNAGTLFPIGSASNKEATAVLANININFATPILTISEAIAKFQSHSCKKTIVNISSGAALNAYAGWSLYCASKAGIEHFVRATSIEQQAQDFPFSIVNVNPGVIDTEMQALIRESDEVDFPQVNRFIKRKTDGELQTPADVALRVKRIVDSDATESGGRYNASDFGS